MPRIVPSPLAPLAARPPRRARFAVRPAAPRPLPPVAELLAGAAVADLTPPPGMPKAGYSANAHDGAGFRTRLRASVLHLRHGTTSLALVQCDLLGGSSVVQHLVAAAVAERTDIPLAGLFIGATHTHAGPGQFCGTDFYNRFASNRSGFDPGYTAFLVEQIAAAVVEAHDTRQPARLAVGTRDVWGLTRNRSLDAHVRNRTVGDTRTTPERKFLAVNPALHLVRVDRVLADGTSAPLAAHLVFSVHGTGIPMVADEYNADLWAYLKGELAHRVEQATGHRPVVGAMEGTHADVAPALRPGTAGHLEAGRLGRAMGAEAARLHADLVAELTGDAPLAVAFRELDFARPDDRTIDGITIPRRPAVGAALIAGAHENVTPVVHRIPPFRAGMPKPVGHAAEQGRKWVLGSRWLQPVVLPLHGFPRVLPLQILRIGPLLVVGAPFEITVETGRRVEAAVARAAASGMAGVTTVAVSSVANEYFGYAATGEEYDRQHYEGAHTLFGPRFERYLSAQAARLAADLGGSAVLHDALPERTWDLRVVPHLQRATAGATTDSPSARRITRPPRFVDPTRTTDGYWELTWVDAHPGALDWHEPIVRVEVHDSTGWRVATSRDGHRVDDDGWHLEVRHEGARHGQHRYVARWWDPTTQGDRSYRFVLAANRGRPETVSVPFP